MDSAATILQMVSSHMKKASKIMNAVGIGSLIIERDTDGKYTFVIHQTHSSVVMKPRETGISGGGEINKMKPVYILGHERFSTKAAIKKRCQELLHDTNLHGKRLEGDDLSFMYDLFCRHPRYEEKVGTGIQGFTIMKRGLHQCFIAIRTDGTLADFSYRKCTQTPEQAVQDRERQVFRRAITYDKQIEAFRRRYGIKVQCAICNKDLYNRREGDAPDKDAETAQVDHVNPKFREIRAGFSQEHLPDGFPLEDDKRQRSIVRVKYFGMDVWCINPETALFRKWCDFHQGRATYRFLCGKHNGEEH